RQRLNEISVKHLKQWILEHADHPFPTKAEKMELCHMTGLNMTQVENWMINV
ncbi:hypothetical protein R3P38DRAFT_2445577, partial [Favolaschia claudopus]